MTTEAARLAACLLAALVTASCTSSEGLLPPAGIGSDGQAASSVGATSSPSSLAAASPALAPSAAPAPQPALSGEPPPAFSGPQPSAATSPTMPQSGGGAVAALASSPIQFAPITGATREAAAPLSERLAARARERGIALAGGGAQPAYILKGYFSEVTEGKATTVIYVWDVMDAAGNRLHRIQGQAKADGAGGWSAVSAKTMQAIADRTIDELAQWLSMRTG
jgi:hypothetical protein